LGTQWHAQPGRLGLFLIDLLPEDCYGHLGLDAARAHAGHRLWLCFLDIPLGNDDICIGAAAAAAGGRPRVDVIVDGHRGELGRRPGVGVGCDQEARAQLAYSSFLGVFSVWTLAVSPSRRKSLEKCFLEAPRRGSSFGTVRTRHGTRGQISANLQLFIASSFPGSATAPSEYSSYYDGTAVLAY
jgi:hypothetical protein